MKKHLNHHSISLFLFTIYIQCTEHNDDPFEDCLYGYTLPIRTDTGAKTIGFILDGLVWRPKGYSISGISSVDNKLSGNFDKQTGKLSIWVAKSWFGNTGIFTPILHEELEQYVQKKWKSRIWIINK